MINGALAIVGMFVALMFGGFAGMWAIWPTAYRHGYAEGESDRHRHRRGDAQETTLLQLPRAGRIPLDRLADPEPLPGEPLFLFPGEPTRGWAAESAEYELLTQTAEQPELTEDDTAEIPGQLPLPFETGDETDSSFTRRMAREVDELVAKWEGDTNYLMFLMKDVG